MKTVLITGASRGIGAEIARIFAKSKEYNVALNYNKSDVHVNELKTELEQYGCNVFLIKADVSNELEVINMVDNVLKKFGKIDVLINNAGVSLYELLIDFNVDSYEKVFGTNVLGTMLCCREVGHNMIENQYGKIVNISSVWGKVGASMESVYSASKGAVIAWTKSLAKELALSNINVNCICPGVIDTEMNAKLDKKTIEELKQVTPLNRIGTPIDVANLAFFLANDKSDFITGEVIDVDGGFVL